MDPTSILVRVLACSLIISATHFSEDDCGPVDCTRTTIYGSYHVNCSYRHFSSVPKNLPGNTTYLDLSENAITVLHDNSFIGLPILVTLLLNANALRDISLIAFHGLSNLQTLYLQNNNLNFSVLQQDVFGPLSSLQELYLGKNPVILNGIHYPENMFRSLCSVRVLGIDTDTNSVFLQGFSRLRKLKHLYLGSFEDMNTCRLAFLRNDTFQHFQNVSLEILDLSGCSSLKAIEKLTFQYFPSLQVLLLRDVVSIPIRIVTQALSMFSGKTMKIIDMYAVHRRIDAVVDFSDWELTGEVMGPLLDICLESLNLAFNQLLYVDVSAMKHRRMTKCLLRLDASGNNFLGGTSLWIDIRSFIKLRFLNVESYSVKKYSVGFTNHRVSNKINTARRNQFPPSFNFTIELPRDLIEVNFCGIMHLQDNLKRANLYFTQGANFKKFDLSYVGLRNIKKNIFGLYNLEVLDMSGNDFAGVTPSFFDTFPSLQKLVLRAINIQGCNYFQQLFSNLGNLKSLDLTGNKIRHFPSTVFDAIPNISEIILSDNTLEFIPVNLSSTPHLTHLNMSKNLLTYIPRHQRTLLDKMAEDRRLSLSLEGNSLSCGCQTLDFIEWLAQTKVKLDNDGVFLCLDQNGLLTNTSYVLKNYKQFWRQCVGTSSLYITIIIWVNLILTLSIGWIISNHWLVIKPFFFKKLIGVTPLHRKDFQYDIYIGHSETDYSFACLSLGLALKEAFGLKTFLRDLDSVPGEAIATEVIRGVRSSWINLILLTEGFQTDEWINYIMEQAVYETRSMPKRLILVAVGEVDIGLIFESLLRSLNNDNVLVCDDFLEVIARLDEIYKLVM